MSEKISLDSSGLQQYLMHANVVGLSLVNI